MEDHRHCIVCGKPVPFERYLCSPSCEEIFKRQHRRLQRTRLATLVFFVVLFFFILALSALRG